MPALNAGSNELYADYELLRHVLEPNTLSLGGRVQEIVICLLVAGILAIKGFRSNQLLIKQADIAA